MRLGRNYMIIKSDSLVLTIKTTTIIMKMTFTDIHWRNQEDMEYFNLHAIKSITLDGMEKGTITIDCVAGDFKSLYCNLTFGGGITHYDLITNYNDDFISLAIFEDKVCIAPAAYVPKWFKEKCKFFCR